MKSARITKLLLLFALAAPWSAAQQAKDQPLKLIIQQTSPKPTFEVEFHNSGKQPLYLNLWNEGSGKPVSAIHLSLTDATGKTVPLIERDRSRDTPGVTITGSSIGYYLLQPEESFTMQFDSEGLSFSGETNRLSLAPGRYTLKAVYIGEDFHYDIGHRFWTGTLTSNTLPFTIPAE